MALNVALLFTFAFAFYGLAAGDISDWSDYDGDDDGDYAEVESSYYTRCDALADADESRSAQRDCMASSSSRDAARGGRPPDMEINESVHAWLSSKGYSNEEIAAYFGISKRARVELPSLEVLRAVWVPAARGGPSRLPVSEFTAACLLSASTHSSSRIERPWSCQSASTLWASTARTTLRARPR